MSTVTFYITRHGKTIMNTLERMQGWCDSPLTPAGIEVAEYLGKGLHTVDFQSAYCSTLRRTLQTAKIVLDAKGQAGLPIIEHEGFKEVGFGSFESQDESDMWVKISLYMQYLNPSDIDKDLASGRLKYGDISDTIAKMDPWQMAENWQTLENRTQSTLKEVAEYELKKGSKNVLVVCHAMAIAGMLLSLGGDKLIKGDLKNASVCKVLYSNGTFTVESMGDMSYVEKGIALFEKCNKF